MKKNKHIIQKVFLEIETDSMGKAMAVKDNIDGFIKNELYPILEKEFSHFSSDQNTIIQIDRLEIELYKTDTNFTTNNRAIQADISVAIHKKIQEKLASVSQSGAKEIQFSSPEIKHREAFLYFLEKGEMPWWYQEETDTFFTESRLQAILNHEATLLQTERLLLHQPHAQLRLVKQFNDAQFLTLLNALFSDYKSNQSSLQTTLPEWFQKQNSVVKHQLKIGLVKFLLNHKEQEFLRPLYESVSDELEADSKGSPTEKHLEEMKNRIADLTLRIPSLKTATLQRKIKDTFDKLHIILTENKAGKNTKASEIEITKKTTPPKATQENYSDSAEKQNDALSGSQPDFHLNLTEKIKNFLATTDDKNQMVPSVEKGSASKEKKQTEPAIIQQYIKNAGLIIVHPFLKNLMANCFLLDTENQLTNPERAAHLLHFAATGMEHDYEYNMRFEKFICGIPLDMPLEREITLSTHEKSEVKSMLEAVLQHWTSLKSNSIDLLRHEFLQREGKLDTAGQNPKLIIERKTFDMLMDSIPWNISVVKIPWHQKIIYTEW